MIDGLSFFLYSRDGSTLESTNFSAGVKNYQHQWIGGPSEASWEFIDIPETGVRSWFGRNLMKQVRVFAGSAEVWRGWIWAMEGIGKGGTWQVNMDDCYNRVKVSRTSSTGETDYRPHREPTDTERDSRGFDDDNTIPIWVSHQASFDLYGPMEYIDSISGTSTTEAEEYANALLSRHADPYEIEPPVFAPALKERLSVTCVGAQVVANRIYLSDGELLHYWTDDPDGPDDKYGQLRYYNATSPTPPHGLNLSTSTSTYVREWGFTGTSDDPWTVTKEILRIIRVVNAAWPGLLYELDIANNTVKTAAGVSRPTGAWSRMVELAQIPDGDGFGYALHVTPDGGVIYKRLIDLPVLYNAYASERGVEKPDGSRPRWDARPGIIQTVGGFGYRRLPPAYTNYIESEQGESPGPYLPAGQVYAERIDMADGDEQASFSGRKETPAHLRRAMDINMRWLEQSQERDRTGSGGSSSKESGGGGSLWAGDDSWWDDILNP